MVEIFLSLRLIYLMKIIHINCVYIYFGTNKARQNGKVKKKIKTENNLTIIPFSTHMLIHYIAALLYEWMLDT